MGATHAGVNRGETFAGYTKLEVEVCTCGVLFAAPEHMLDKRREDGKSFYCPNGHSLVYGSENAKLKAQLQRERDRAGRLAARLDQTEASRRAYKGQATRIKNRVSKGVCPCCNRSFRDLARHMKSKHPDFAAERPQEPKG